MSPGTNSTPGKARNSDITFVRGSFVDNDNSNDGPLLLVLLLLLTLVLRTRHRVAMPCCESCRIASRPNRPVVPITATVFGNSKAHPVPTKKGMIRMMGTKIHVWNVGSKVDVLIGIKRCTLPCYRQTPLWTE